MAEFEFISEENYPKHKPSYELALFSKDRFNPISDELLLESVTHDPIGITSQVSRPYDVQRRMVTSTGFEYLDRLRAKNEVDDLEYGSPQWVDKGVLVFIDDNSPTKEQLKDHLLKGIPPAFRQAAVRRFEFLKRRGYIR